MKKSKVKKEKREGKEKTMTKKMTGILLVIILLPIPSNGQEKKFTWPFLYFQTGQNSSKHPVIYSTFGEFRTSKPSKASPIPLHEAVDIDPFQFYAPGGYAGRPVYACGPGFLTRFLFTGDARYIRSWEDRVLASGSHGSGAIKIGNFGYNHVRNFQWTNMIISQAKQTERPRAVLVVNGPTKVFISKRSLPKLLQNGLLSKNVFFLNAAEIQLYQTRNFNIEKNIISAFQIDGKRYITVAEFLPGKWVWAVYWPKSLPIMEGPKNNDVHINFHKDPSPRSRYAVNYQIGDNSYQTSSDYDNPLLYLPYTNAVKPVIGNIYFRNPSTKTEILARKGYRLAISKQVQNAGVEIIAVAATIHPGRNAQSGIYRIGYRVEGIGPATRGTKKPEQDDLFLTWTFDKLPPKMLSFNSQDRKLVVVDGKYSKYKTLTNKHTAYVVSRTNGDENKTFEIASLPDGLYEITIIAENIKKGGDGSGKRAVIDPAKDLNRTEKKQKILIDHTSPKFHLMKVR